MLTTAILVPLLGAVAVAVLGRRWSDGVARAVGVGVTIVPLALVVAAWAAFDRSSPELFQLVTEVDWIPTLGVGYRVGVDGIALAVAGVTAVVFTAAVAHPAETRGIAHQYVAWFLFLESASLGLFFALDLVLFYVFFDLSLVGMYFLVSRWGHDDAERAALKFFLYTFLGSLSLLVGIIALGLSMDPITFDMRAIIDAQPLAAAGHAMVVLVLVLVGLGIKTPVVPFHTWLPAAHVEAPATASAVLAGVLLKMGTFGLIRIPYAMMRETFADAAVVVGIVAVISILYGALVALGQGDLKRRIAYTSVNHMGYVVLGVAAAGSVLTGDEAARGLALTGATVQMVAHGLITGALFLLTGSIWRRTHDFDLDHYGGLLATVPLLAGATILASFASLGLPGLAGFVGEFQIFVGTFAVLPVLAGIGLLGIVITAALFLQLLQRLFLGELPEDLATMPDLDPVERTTLAGLLALVVLIGVAPRFLVDTANAAASILVGG
ncbi:complex I subunit 4 family protein [Salsipaludibacter albus]|uniref:complex I subunit 4 family protein n=1 Tax=Salsipaludibacter albus TaxID=2849650 RepID=UPI001EE400E0|nr:NADH-quinone oxidoreductase subunit M [Salsipaludibacter albus]MBY5161392.1 NADH-quinone oxidoreductase subunit M [Salsipaludibacter albus]